MSSETCDDEDDIINPSIMIRRSIIGSLRGNPTPPPVIRRIETNQITLIREPAEPRQPELQESHDPLPKLDQSIDFICSGDLSIDETQVFEQSLPKDPSINRKHPLLRLPAKLRQQIYSCCFPDESRKIILSPEFTRSRVYPKDHFASPWVVLDGVWGGLESFRALRHDLMTYFWTRYHFQAILTPFNGPFFCPLSHFWLRDNLHIVQHLTLEVDFTRFGGSALKLAPKFGYYMEPTEVLLVNAVMGLIKRKDTPMEELHLMCRRYTGIRPHVEPVLGEYEEARPAGEEIPWAPEHVTYICDAICEMRGILQNFRISGFTQAYTKRLLVALYGQGNKEPDWITASDVAWPPAPPPEPETPHSTISRTAPIIHEILTIPESPMTSAAPVTPTNPIAPSIISSTSQSSLRPSDFSLKLTRSRSFREDFEEQMTKSKLYSNYTPDNLMDGSDVAEDKSVGDAKSYKTASSISYLLQDCYNHCDSQGNSIAAATPRSCSLHQVPLSTPPEAADHLSPPSQTRCTTPKSPNAMNQRNEQDPAFLRTLEALHQLDEIPKAQPGARPLSVQLIPRPVITLADRSVTSPIKIQCAGAKKRYLTFVNILRGRTD